MSQGEMSWKVTTQANQKRLRLWKEITKLSAKKKKKRLTQIHTQTLWINTTAAIEQVTSNMQANRKSSLRRQQIKCEEQKHVNLLCPKESECLCLLHDRFFNCFLLAPTSSIRDDKCDMTALLGKLQQLQTENYWQQRVRQGKVCQTKYRYSDLLFSLGPVLKVTQQGQLEALVIFLSLKQNKKKDIVIRTCQS